MRNLNLPTCSASAARRKFLLGAAGLTGSALLTDALAAVATCQPTEQDIIGPFYRFGAPFETRIAGAEETGDRLIVSGTVYSQDCRTPVANALIEVWQADKDGRYDTNTPGNFTERNTFRLRGMMLTDRQGRYEFETVMPGRYPVPPGLPGLEQFGGITRPAHIHFRVADSLHIPLTTQLYFAGDPFAKSKPGLAITLKSAGPMLRGTFDIVLARGY